MATRSKTQEELTETAWKLLEEAITDGSMTLAGKQGVETKVLSTEQLVDLVKWLTSMKVKKPSIGDIPEDFQPPETRVGSGDDYEDV